VGNSLFLYIPKQKFPKKPRGKGEFSGKKQARMSKPGDVLPGGPRQFVPGGHQAKETKKKHSPYPGLFFFSWVRGVGGNPPPHKVPKWSRGRGAKGFPGGREKKNPPRDVPPIE